MGNVCTELVNLGTRVTPSPNYYGSYLGFLIGDLPLRSTNFVHVIDPQELWLTINKRLVASVHEEKVCDQPIGVAIGRV